MINQKGITGIILAGAVAAVVIIGIIAVVLGGSLLNKQSANKTSTTQTVPKQSGEVSKSAKSAGQAKTTPQPSACDRDYTGCDVSGNFMTWKDDGKR